MDFELSDFFQNFYLIGALLGILVTWISVADLRRRIVPDLPLVLLFLIAIFFTPLALEANILFRLAIGLGILIVLWCLGEIYFRKFGREGLGIGDAKLFGVSVFLLGPASIPSLFFLSSSGGILAILTMRAFRNEPVDGIPFAPFISYAVIVIYFFGPIPF